MPIKKSVSSVIMALVMTTASFAATVPTKISTLDQLKTITASGSYALDNDIVIDGDFTPIGTLTTPFNGDFNGNGFTISGFNVNRTDSATGWAVGLFGVIGKEGKVRNLRAVGDVAGYHAAGVLAGINSGLIEGCYGGGSVSTVRLRESNAGGLVGINGGRIYESYSDAAVGGDRTQNAGGLVGFLTNTSGGLINDCFALGSVEGVRSAGGLVGYVFSGSVSNSYAAGEVKPSKASGGLIGFDYGHSVSWNMQGRSGGSYVKNAVVDKSYWDMEATKQVSSACVGGIGLSTADMKEVGSILGWDTSGIWEKVGGEYPKLREYQTEVEYLAGLGGRLIVLGEAGFLPKFDVTLKGVSRGPFVAAAPASGYRFAGWRVNGNDDNDNKAMTRFDSGVFGENRVTEIKITAIFEPVGAASIPISNLSDLRKIGKDPNYPLSGNYVLTADIIGDDNDDDFTPIGAAAAPFTGTFTGKGGNALILDLRIASTTAGTENAGLFGYANGAVIRGVSLQVSASGRMSAGTLAGVIENTFIDSCAAIGGSAQSSGGAAGGLVGSSLSSVIIRSSSSASSKAAGAGAGGLAGAAYNSFIAYSYATFNAEAQTAAGGLAGRNSNSAVQFCYSTGNVEAQTALAGGLTGEIAEGGIVYESYSAGQIVAAGIERFNITGAAAQDNAVSASYFITPSPQSGGFGSGLTSAAMKNSSSYTGWNFTTVWDIAEGSSYPYLREITPSADYLPGLGKSSEKPVSSNVRSAPLASVKGRMLTINADPKTALQINLIDMRGRVIARYNTKGSARVSISKIPSGRYILEAKENGKRVNVSNIMVR